MARAARAKAAGAGADPDLVEVRGMYPREVVEALDMIALAKKRTRYDLVGHVFRLYVATKQHEASLVSRTRTVNPSNLDSDWIGLG